LDDRRVQRRTRGDPPASNFSPPFVGRAIDVRAIFNASDNIVDFVCGTCEAVLMHGERRRACGSYNATNE
jgi:hypothetical protein